MTTLTRPITADELLRMSGNGHRELVRGEVREMAPAGFGHGAVSNQIAYLLTRHVNDHDLGIVGAAETGFRLSSGPDTVRAPDVCFVRKDRLPASGLPAGYWEGPPDLAVEVISPGDRLSEVDDKVDDFLSAGTPLVWVVNPRRKTVTIHRPGRQPVMIGEADALDGGDVVPGFRCAVPDLFR